MVKQVINIGAGPNDGTGDPLRTAFTKINANFTELYGNVGATDVYTTYTPGANLILAPTYSANVLINGTSAIVANATNFTSMTANNALFTGVVTINPSYSIIGNLSGTASSATIATTALYATTAGSATNAINFSGNNLPNVNTIGNLISANIGIANINNLYSNSNIFATGNLSTSGFVTGNGYYLSGLSVGPASYGNSNVAAYLPINTGNVNANWIIANTISSVIGTGGNLILDPDGNGDVVAVANLWINSGYLRTTSSSLFLSNSTPTSVYAFGNATTILMGNANATTTIPGNIIIGKTANVGANLSVTGNISGNYITATGNIVAANITTSGNINSSGNVSAIYLIGNGSALTGMYGNTQAAAYLLGNLTYGNAAIAGVAATGNVSAAYFVGSGAALTGLYGNTQAGAYIGTYLPTYTGNLTAGNLVTTGNVGSTFFIGNGSLLTGIYSNVTAAAYLPTYSGNINAGNVTTTGNISANYILGSGKYLSGVYSNVDMIANIGSTVTITKGLESNTYVLSYITVNGYTYANLANTTSNTLSLSGNTSTLILDNTLGSTIAIANIYLPANANVGDGTRFTISSNINITSLRIIANDSTVQGNVTSISPTTPYSWHYIKYQPYSGSTNLQPFPGGPRWIRV